MDFSSVFPYLKGQRFSNGLEFNLKNLDSNMLYRIELLSQLVKGKRVIHLGCADHLPLIDKKIQEGTWLHEHLVRESSHCLGIDINYKAVQYIQHLGYKDVVCGDITEGIDEVYKNKWDYIIMGEILEHVENPCSFLNKVSHACKESIEKILITVPNAFRLNNFNLAKNGIELINSDHYYWFTPYTLMKVLANSGYEPEHIWLCESFKPNAKTYYRNLFYYTALKRYPLMRDTMVISACI